MLVKVYRLLQRPLTVKVAFLGYCIDFGEAPKMRSKSLDMAPIEALAGLDEIKIMFLELPLLHRLLLSFFVAELYECQLDPPSTAF